MNVTRTSSIQRSLAIIGAAGFNSQQRVMPAVAAFNGHLEAIGFDIRVPEQPSHTVPIQPVRDNVALREALLREARTDVLIETIDELHIEHILLALDCGARRVYCEKCVGLRSDDATSLLNRAIRLEPDQRAFIVDHYLGLDLVLTLFANRERWLGEVHFISGTLLERQGIPPHQERSHAHGQGGFLHHIIAFAGLFLDLDALEPMTAAWAKHLDAPASVADTFRSARFRNRGTGEIVLDATVAKYMPQPTKTILVEGTLGTAVIDRDNHELRVERPGLPPVVLTGSASDTGYGELMQAIANGTTLPTLLTIEQAMRVLRLIEEAHDIARELTVYPSGVEQPFGRNARRLAA